MPETFLITGFEPFRQHRVNSSWEALRQLDGRWPAQVRTLCLPVEHVEAHRQLRSAVDTLRPRAVLCTGLAVGEVFRMEQRARRPPELFHVEGDEQIEGAWPWDEMEQQLTRAGVSPMRSDNAGQFVCESTYWSLLAYRATHGFPVNAAFLHVPPLSQAFPVERIARALECVVDARAHALAAEPTPQI